MAGKVAVEIAVTPDDPCSAFSAVDLRSSSIKAKRVVIRSAVLAAGRLFRGAGCREWFDRFSVLLSGHKAGQSFAGVGNSTLCTKRISLVVPSMSVTMARIMVSPEWA